MEDLICKKLTEVSSLVTYGPAGTSENLLMATPIQWSLVGKRHDVRDVDVQCQVATQHKHCAKLQAGHLLLQLLIYQCQPTLQGSCPVGDHIDCTLEQLHQGPGGTLPWSGTKLVPSLVSARLRLEALVVNPEATMIALARLLTFQDSDLVDCVGGLASNLVAASRHLQHSIAAVAVIGKVTMEKGGVGAGCPWDHLEFLSSHSQLAHRLGSPAILDSILHGSLKVRYHKGGH
jgi:hypothetical protein